MVVFTCSHCGESIKKPAVEKHKFKCKKYVSLTCMDCLKDFDEITYKAHNQCISEEQRYSAKDFVPKSSANSGAKKQESWSEVVKSIIKNPSEFNVDKSTMRILRSLENYDNIPRKKVKFINFLCNSMRVRKDQCEVAWNVIEKALEVWKQNTKPATVQDTTLNENKNESNANDDNDNDEKESKQKKKRTADTENDDKNVKKKKVKKTVNENGIDSSVDVHVDSDNTENLIEVEKTNGEMKIKDKKNKKKENNTDKVEVNSFDWNAALVKIMNDHPDGLSTPKLKKKVLKLYMVHSGIDKMLEEAEKMFTSKLKKAKKFGFVVENDDFVKLS